MTIRPGTVLLAIALAACPPLLASCRWESGKIGGPAFKRFSKVHPFAPAPGVHRAGPLELEVTGGNATEVYTAIGNEYWLVLFEVRLRNTTRQVVWMNQLPVDVASPKASSGGGTYPSPRGPPGAWRASPDGKAHGLEPGAEGAASFQFNVSSGDLLAAPITLLAGDARVEVHAAR